MEYISIGRGNMKVILSADEMREYGLSSGAGTGREEADVFRKMMKIIGKETGFTVGENRTEVRMFPSRGGGCELYLFKTPYVENGTRNTNNEITEVSQEHSRRSCSTYRIKTTGENKLKRTFYADDYAIYGFDSLADAAMLCKRLKGCNYSEKSDLYFVNDSPDGLRKTYYLVLSDKVFFANEYNGTLLSESRYYFVKEHGYLICKDAVLTVGALF